MKVTLQFILSNWGLWPLLTALFSLVFGVGLTRNWGNAALWLWFSLIIVTLITQLYVMLQYVKARKWMSAFMLLLLMVVSMMSFFLFFAIAVMSDGKGLPMQAVWRWKSKKNNVFTNIVLSFLVENQQHHIVVFYRIWLRFVKFQPTFLYKAVPLPYWCAMQKTPYQHRKRVSPWHHFLEIIGQSHLPSVGTSIGWLAG